MKQINLYASNYNDKILGSLKQQESLHILYGGSASGKSFGIAQYYIEAVLSLNRNVLALRKVGNTIKNSIFALFNQVINLYNVQHLFKINKTEFTITCFNGYKIMCGGLDDPEKIKSITVEKGVLTDIWLEEATEFTEEDFNQLSLRMRGLSKKIKRIRMSFNPISNLHWIKKRFFDKIQDDTFILKTTYKDNNFLTDQDKKNIENLKNVDEVFYNVYALGNWGVLGNLVFNNWQVQDLNDIKDSFNCYYYGLDFGFTNHPSALIKCALKEDNIYILDEFYAKGQTNQDLANICKDFVKGYIYCDSAEPKSIKELRLLGINALAVDKGKDSVKHGIQWIKQHKIIIDKKCQNFINEIQTYKYKENKDGEVMNEPIDLNNHGIDAVRYALEYMMKQFNKSSLTAGQLGL